MRVPLDLPFDRCTMTSPPTLLLDHQPIHLGSYTIRGKTRRGAPKKEATAPLSGVAASRALARTFHFIAPSAAVFLWYNFRENSFATEPMDGSSISSQGELVSLQRNQQRHAHQSVYIGGSRDTRVENWIEMCPDVDSSLAPCTIKRGSSERTLAHDVAWKTVEIAAYREHL